MDEIIREVTPEQLKEGWMEMVAIKREYIVLKTLPNGNHVVLEPTPELIEKGGIYYSSVYGRETQNVRRS